MTDSELIDMAGGTRTIARLCGVTDSAITQWRTNGIPRARVLYLELALPKVFGKKAPWRILEQQKKAAQSDRRAAQADRRQAKADRRLSNQREGS